MAIAEPHEKHVLPDDPTLDQSRPVGLYWPYRPRNELRKRPPSKFRMLHNIRDFVLGK